MPWQGAMSICYHEDVTYSEKVKWFNDKKYPMKFSHGSCKANKIGIVGHSWGSDAKKDDRIHKDYSTYQAGINMSNFYGNKYCGKTIVKDGDVLT